MNLQPFFLYVYIPSSYAKTLGITNFQLREFPRSGWKMLALKSRKMAWKSAFCFIKKTLIILTFLKKFSFRSFPFKWVKSNRHSREKKWEILQGLGLVQAPWLEIEPASRLDQNEYSCHSIFWWDFNDSDF